MSRIVRGKLFKVSYSSGRSVIVECNTDVDLLEFVIMSEMTKEAIKSVIEIDCSVWPPKTYRVAIKSHPLYEAHKKKYERQIEKGKEALFDSIYVNCLKDGKVTVDGLGTFVLDENKKLKLEE